MKLEELNISKISEKIKPVLPWLAVIVLSIILLWPKPKLIDNSGQRSYIDSAKIEKINYKIDSLTNIINSDKQAIYDLENKILIMDKNINKVKSDISKVRGNKQNEIDKINNLDTDGLINVFSNYSTN
jgi:hypothetical protein